MSKVVPRAAVAALVLVAVGCGRSAAPTESSAPPPPGTPPAVVIGQQPSGGQPVVQGQSEQLLRNPGFEQVPQVVPKEEGHLPNEWVQCQPAPLGADTYSNDGSWGLVPHSLGNFTGCTAAEGKRWAAGAQLGPLREAFGQKLTRPLQPGMPYRFSAQLLESTRFKTRVTCELVLSPSAAYDVKGAVSLGKLDPTTVTGKWEPRTFTFSAPKGADQLPYFVLVPRSADGVSHAYIGLDDLSLTAGQ